MLLKTAVSRAMSLSLESGYTTDMTIDLLLAKTSRQAGILKQQVQEKDPAIEF